MKCSVIDDEPYALELIKDYIKKTPFLELGECFSNPLKAMNYLSSEVTDLIFLDINMPEISGIQLLKSLPRPPLVIFTTAYPEFGAESYEYSAIDYLLKPIKYERFLKSVNKAATFFRSRCEHQNSLPDIDKNEYIFIKSGTRLVKISPADILYIEGAGNYMIFCTSEKKIMSLLTMQETIDLLPADKFVRIHKSYIISLTHIDAVEKHDVIINGQQVPIGITYQEHFFKMINK